MKRIAGQGVLLMVLASSAAGVFAQTQYETPRSAAMPPIRSQYEPQGSNLGSNPDTRTTLADPRTRAKLHTELGAMYFQSGNMGVALDELKAALEADSKYAPAYSVRGLVHAHLREFAQAEEQFQKALDITPNDPDVNNNYGWFLCQTGKERQSIAYFLNALKNPLYTTPEIAYANAGGCALKAGDLEGAESYLGNAIRMSRDGNIGPRVQMAEVAYKRGNLEDARRWIGGVLREISQPPADALWLGLRVERKLGNRTAEGMLAAQLRARFPDSPEYQSFLKGNFE